MFDDIDIHEASHAVMYELKGFAVQSCWAKPWREELIAEILGPEYCTGVAGQTAIKRLPRGIPLETLMPVNVAGAVGVEISSVSWQPDAITDDLRVGIALRAAQRILDGGTFGNDREHCIATLKAAIEFPVIAPQFLCDALKSYCCETTFPLMQRWPAVVKLAQILHNGHDVNSNGITACLRWHDPNYRVTRWAIARTCSLVGGRI